MQLQQVIKNHLSQKFKIIKLLGKGSFGNVYECEDLSDWERYAVKVISKLNVKASKIESLKEQAKLLKQLEHENIVKIYEYGQMESCIYIKMEIASKGTLQNLIDQKKMNKESLKDQEIANIMMQIFKGISYIHSLNIIHRDIKPDNILLTEGQHTHQIKIADFGLSTKLNFHYPKSAIVKCGTLLFMAPEIICKYTYTKSIDIWSVAIIMFILFNGKHPIWTDQMTTDQYSSIMAKKVNIPCLKNATKSAQDFFGRIARLDPHERYSAQEGLKHPWITRNPNDQIPLAVHESYSSFSTASQVVKLVKIFITTRVICEKNNLEIPAEYRSRIANRSPSPKREHSSAAYRLKKLKTLNIEKDFKLHDKLQQVEGHPKAKFRVSSENEPETPAINKLNQIFNTLFDKKITSRAKLAVNEKKQNPYEVIQPNITHFKDTIEKQIEKSVLEVLQNNKHKNRRILPTKNDKKDTSFLRDVEIVSDGSKSTSFIRKSKIKRRNNTTEEKNVSK